MPPASTTRVRSSDIIPKAPIISDNLTSVVEAGGEGGGSQGFVVDDIVANGINNADQIVGFYDISPIGGQGFIYQNGTYTTLDDPAAGETEPTGINNAGQFIGTYTDATGIHGFVYSNGTYTTLDDPLAAPGKTYASSINDEGDVVGTYTDSTGNHGFLAIPISNTLKLDNAPQYTGTISGFAPGNWIDLTDINFATIQSLQYKANSAATGGTLTVSDGTHVAHLALSGQYTAASFQDTADSGAGTIIGIVPSHLM
jgi:probable HAF family extracellular repeat protein